MYLGRKSNNDVAIFRYHGDNVDILIIKFGYYSEQEVQNLGSIFIIYTPI